MKINKTISYALATSLLLGGTFLGTKATLIDKETANNKLSLRTGNLQIRLIPGTWIRNAKDTNGDNHITTSDNPEDQGCETNETGSFKNVQAGDTFTRYISILNGANDSDITLNIEKELSGNDNELMKFITVDSSHLERLKSINKNINSGGYITIKIDDSKEAQMAFNGSKTLNLNAVYTVTATTSDGKQVATLEETPSN